MLPMTDAELVSLLDVLDESLGGRGCDHSFAITERWLCEHGKGGEVLQGLQQLGAYCDCEVLLPVKGRRCACWRAGTADAAAELSPAKRSRPRRHVSG